MFSFLGIAVVVIFALGYWAGRVYAIPRARPIRRGSIKGKQ
jgi:hypothetical protein